MSVRPYPAAMMSGVKPYGVGPGASLNHAAHPSMLSRVRVMQDDEETS